MDKREQTESQDVVTDHRRQWRNCRYVYPVISRRARGVSIGINLNLDKRCSFGCLYCQVDRKLRRKPMEVLIPRLAEELELALCRVGSGKLWEEQRFRETPAQMRRINDIAFSGDGEPTCLDNFDQAVSIAAEVLARHRRANPQDPNLEHIKIVVITNASHLQSPQLRRALPILDANNGEIWAKLDAGSEEFFRKVNRPLAGLTLQDIMDNILAVAVVRPVVIQTLLFCIDGQRPGDEEIDAYCHRLRWLIGCSGGVKLVQLHTLARPPTASNASPLPNEKLDEIADTVRGNIGDVPVEVYYGRDVAPQANPAKS